MTPDVGIVVGKDTDEQAIHEVLRALKDADVKRIVRINAGEKVTTPVTIWIGGPSENKGSALFFVYVVSGYVKGEYDRKTCDLFMPN